MLLDFHSEIYSWIRGGLFVLFLYHFLIYFQNKSKLYLFYSLYLLAMSVYLLKHIAPDNPEITTFYHYFNFPLQFLAHAAYIAFARDLLETRSYIVKWDKYLRIEIKMLVFLAPVFFLIQLILGHEFQERAFVIIAPLLTLFAFASYFVILKWINNILSWYFVGGSLLYLLLANISFTEMIIGKEYFIEAGIEPMFFVYLGVMLQAIIFAIIIGFTIKRFEQKSINAEMKLAVKQKEMEELKMTALQSQMNPHFLFNSLNSINNFVLKNDVEKASDYITKFSKLIRVILNSSSSPTTTLAEEIEILSLYVKLEQMRVSGGFEYIVNLDENLNPDSIIVPPLFLQPFIENAIWHGIMKKEGDKRIELTIKKENEKIIFIVQDNGIGINKAKELSYMTQKRKFFGIEATENRIKILYKNKDVSINTTDISDDKNTGTKVEISISLNS